MTPDDVPITKHKYTMTTLKLKKGASIIKVWNPYNTHDDGTIRQDLPNWMCERFYKRDDETLAEFMERISETDSDDGGCCTSDIQNAIDMAEGGTGYVFNENDYIIIRKSDIVSLD